MARAARPMRRSPALFARRSSNKRAFPVNLEMTDTNVRTISSMMLVGQSNERDPSKQSARLATQFIRQNQANLHQLGVTAEPRYDGSNIDMVFRSGTKVGAVALVSPTTGRHEYGLIVRPRFEWNGLGGMLHQMGWKIVPSLLRSHALPQSDRKIPPWVLSTVVLLRLRALLRSLERRFELVEEERNAPRGNVDWQRYVTKNVTRARFLDVPCRYTDLRDDAALKSAIRFTLDRQLDSLTGQRAAGPHVLRLIEICADLLIKVHDVPSRPPSPVELQRWLTGGRLTSQALTDGIEAIEWTADERGLAGLSDLQGLPWVMSMEEFFEAWCETILAGVAKKIGGTLRSGRLRQTVAPLSWVPPYAGSQKSLIPDVILERDGLAVIVDAKYKAHWEELQSHRWTDLDEALQERHRADLLQALAYANLVDSERVVVCLAYPCSSATWQSLRDRNRLFHRASVGTGERRTDVLLGAFPMNGDITTVVDSFVKELV